MLVKRTVALEYGDPLPEPTKTYKVETKERKETLKIARIIGLEWREYDSHKLLLVTVAARIVE